MYLAIGVKDKEVIVPSFTFVATANAVVAAGGIPIFAESEEETFGLDAEDVKKRITKNTKAIVALHYAGGVSKDIEKNTITVSNKEEEISDLSSNKFF